MSGLFTVGRPDPSTGKAHMALVKCDLCSGETIFDPEKIDSINNEIGRIIKDHVCTKKKPEVKRRKFKWLPKPRVSEYEFGTRRRRLGPPEKEDEDAPV